MLPAPLGAPWPRPGKRETLDAECRVFRRELIGRVVKCDPCTTLRAGPWHRQVHEGTAGGVHGWEEQPVGVFFYAHASVALAAERQS